jgi:hypothetical protein
MLPPPSTGGEIHTAFRASANSHHHRERSRPIIEPHAFITQHHNRVKEHVKVHVNVHINECCSAGTNALEKPAAAPPTTKF